MCWKVKTVIIIIIIIMCYIHSCVLVMQQELYAAKLEPVFLYRGRVD